MAKHSSSTAKTGKPTAKYKQGIMRYTQTGHILQRQNLNIFNAMLVMG